MGAIIVTFDNALYQQEVGVLPSDRPVTGKERIVAQRERGDRRGGPMLHVRFTPACSNDNLARTSSGTPGG